MKIMKRRFLIITLTCILFGNIATAQSFIDISSRYERTKKVLLVPFDERIYFNDATYLMAPKDGSTHDELMEYFRYQFNLNLYNALIDSCEVVDLVSNNTREDQEDVSGLYSTIRYNLQLVPQEPTKNNAIARKRFEKEQERRQKELENAKPAIHNGELIGQKQNTDDKYLHIVFDQPEVLAEIARRRGIDYYLFINQFEIKTDYRDPYMSGRSDLKRELRVHFSIYGAAGEFIGGNYAKTSIPFYEDDKTVIVTEYFPEIIRQIISRIKY